MLKKRIIGIALATALCITGCGSSAGVDAGASAQDGAAALDTAAAPEKDAQTDGTGDAVLRIAESKDIVTMDVHKTTDDYLLPMNVFDTLFSFKKNDDGSTEIVNRLVEDYDISEDGKTYHFTLREGVEFSDGTPLKAQDVKFTFECMLSLPESEQTDYAIAIDGAQELMDGKADSLKGITVEDDRNFSITLSEPFAGFIPSLATPSTSIFSEKIVTEAGEDFGTVPEKTIGTGPYIIREWNRGSGLVFEYNPRYWGEEPSVKRVEVTAMEPEVMNMAFQKGDIDILDCLMIDSAIVDSTYKTDAYKDRLVSVDRMGLNYFMLNENVRPLDDVQVRKAIQQAIDRESILASIYGGDGKLEDGIYPTGCIAYSKENQGWLKYDPEAAKKLLADAGYGDGFDMELCLDSSASDSVKNSLQIISQNLNDIGIRANIQTIDHASFLELRNNGEAAAYMGLWLLDFNDPDNIIHTFFGTKDNTKLRSNNYNNDEVIARVGAAKAIVDDSERNKEYAALEKKLVQEDAAWVPMFSLEHLFVVSDRVEQFTPHWAGWSDFYFEGTTLK
ncbi:MAG: ABC transporter substrate-binding protein [Lachnospiraceae bacterium]|nr:ABC transporter substrate-binding protein [Lachnospiraceae bacterium]